MNITYGQYFGQFKGLNCLPGPAVVVVEVHVSNVGAHDGDEVVLVMIKPPPVEGGAPSQNLRNYERISVRAGEAQRVRLSLRWGGRSEGRMVRAVRLWRGRGGASRGPGSASVKGRLPFWRRRATASAAQPGIGDIFRRTLPGNGRLQ